MNAHFGPSTESGMRWRSAGREDFPRSSTRSGYAISEVAASLIGPDESVVCAKRRGGIAYEGRASAALCGRMRHRAQSPHLWLCAERRGRIAYDGRCICGFVRRDEAGSRTRVPHLWLCAERRGRIAYEGPAFVALCGKTRPDRLRRPLHLWLCAERRGRIAYEGPAFVALCGKTRPHW